jgi:uncharacterized protein Yka (UPF0111/DUF47 family)
MAEDPISNLKNKVTETQQLFDDLRIHISQSDQRLASEKIKEIERKFDSIKKKMNSEFGWLMPPKVVEE